MERPQIQDVNSSENTPRPAVGPGAKAAIIAGGLALTLGVGLLDYLTGLEVSFSVFYLLPTAFLAWRGSRGLGLFGAMVSGAVWLVVEYFFTLPANCLSPETCPDTC